MVLVAIPLHAIGTLPTRALAGRVVMDANNYYPERDGHIAELDSGALGSSELLARHLREARVVKVFNAMRAADLRDKSRPAGAQDRLGIPYAGDDTEARAVVAGLIDDMGFDPVDAGSLLGGRNQQPGTAVYGLTADAESVRAAVGNSSEP